MRLINPQTQVAFYFFNPVDGTHVLTKIVPMANADRALEEYERAAKVLGLFVEAY